MARPLPLRSVLVALIGAAVYYALLGLLYARAPYSAIPHWWREFAQSGPVAAASWFTLLNIAGAVLAAIPVAIGVMLGLKVRRAPVGLIIGLVSALVITGGGMLQYGVPPSAGAWVTDVAQFLAVSGAVVGTIVVLESCPLTARWSGQ